MTSGTIRQILQTYHKVTVGTHSYGCCLIPGHLPPDVTVGRYVSMARQVSVFRRNHPLDRMSLHPYFYNAKLGVIDQDNIESVPLEIGHDAWIAEAVRITPGCRRIGIGAVVGTGAVVTKDVPDFAVVAGVPAKVVKFRFEPDRQRGILESRWWEQTKAECARLMKTGDEHSSEPPLAGGFVDLGKS